MTFFVSGQVLGASDLNDLDIDSLTVDDVVNAGAFSWQTFTGKLYELDEGQWEGNELPTSTNTCYYMELGGICFVWGHLVLTSPIPVAAQDIYMRTPIGLTGSIASVGGTYVWIATGASPDDVYPGTIAGHSGADDLIKFWNLIAWGGVYEVDDSMLGNSVTPLSGDILRFQYSFQTDGTAAATT